MTEEEWKISEALGEPPRKPAPAVDWRDMAQCLVEALDFVAYEKHINVEHGNYLLCRLCGAESPIINTIHVTHNHKPSCAFSAYERALAAEGEKERER